MYTLSTSIPLTLALCATVFAQGNGDLPRRATTVSPSLAEATVFTNWAALKTNEGGALKQTVSTYVPETTGAPEHTVDGPEAAGSSLTVNIVNSWSVPVSITANQNYDAPTPTIFPGGIVTSSTQYLFPTGWAGMMAIGKSYDVRGSKIEISFINAVDVDISYVDGYSLPITCSCDGGTVIAGCNKPLFALNTCEDEDSVGPVCINTAGTDGPALTFFAPCEGLAYTYPDDNAANYGNDVCSSNIIDCCVGPACPASSTQTKRGDDSDVVRRHAWPRGAIDANAY